LAATIISNPTRVYDFVTRFMPMQPVGGMKGIGLEKDGELVAGVLYEGFNGRNVWMHVAAEPGRKWAVPEFIRYAFHYPFNELGVERVSGYVASGNKRAVKLDEHLGFQREAVLEGAAEDGSDVWIYVMRRHNCRFLKD
jgi:RimJ/RimL family protein N-acetyltransferase